MKLTTKRLIFLGYFGAVFLLQRLNRFSFSSVFLVNLLKDSAAWFLGAGIGAYFIKIEQLIYVYYFYPDEFLSIEVRKLLKEKNKKSAFLMLKNQVYQQRLAFRSALFQAVWLVLAFFTLTSTAGFFGKALVMAVGLHLLLDEWVDFLGKKNISWLFWQIKRQVSLKEQKWFLWIMTGVFGILSLLLI